MREDYNVLAAVNRHTVTASGWTHEQDNSKVVRENGQIDSTLVKEFGFNDYRRVSGFEFAPAYRYWKATAGYWRKVRKAWAQFLERDQFISLATEIDGMPIIVATFGQASAVEGGGPVPSVTEISELLAPWINVQGSELVTAP